MRTLSFRKFRESLGSFFTQMAMYYSIMIVIALIIFASIIFALFSNTMKSDMFAYTEKISSQTKMSLDNYFSEIVTSLEMVATNPLVLESLVGYKQSSSYTNYTNFQQISGIIQNIKSLNPDISDIFIYNPDYFIKRTLTKSVNVRSRFLQQVWDEAGGDATFMKPAFYPTHVPDYYNLSSQTQNIVTITYPIRDIERYSTSNLAICVIDVNFDRMEQIIEHTKLTEGDRIILMSSEGGVIYSTDSVFEIGASVTEALHLQSALQNDYGTYEVKHEKENLLVTYTTSQVTGWKLVYLSKTAEINKSVFQVFEVMSYLLLAVIAFTVLFSIIIVRKFAKPMKQIVSHMREAGRGDFSIRIPVNMKHLEFRLLGNVFNMMMEKINGLFREVYIVRIKQREAELKALESSIHPHFLNNTLQIIHSLAILDQTREIEQVVTSLGNLLEYSIYEQDKKVRIFQEIGYIEDYLKIHNFRYDFAINVSIKVEEEIKDYQIAKFLLQPLVENAVFHGLDGVEGEKTLYIRGFASEGRIHFIVEDNGVGMTEQKLQQVLMRLEQEEVSGTSIGLSNVQQRVKLEYGAEYGLSFASAPQQGTRVELVIPILDSR